jgi:hypothetical protein
MDGEKMETQVSDLLPPILYQSSYRRFHRSPHLRSVALQHFPCQREDQGNRMSAESQRRL